MNNIYAFFVFPLFILSCSQTQAPQQVNATYVYQTPVVYESYKDLKPLFEKQNDTTYVINFWATWCKPCVKELPYFEDLHNTSQGKKVKVLLVSLDFPDQIEKKLIPFIKEKQLQSEVIVLTDGDANSWISKVAEEWSGSIPATLVYRKDKRAFYEQSFDSFDELNNILKPFTIFKQ